MAIILDGTNGITTPDLETSGSSSISVNSSTDAFRITQLGTGNALVVEDEANPDSSPFVVNALGQVGIGTLTPSDSLEIYGTTSRLFVTANGGSAAYVARRYSNDTANANINIQKSRGTSSTPLVVSTGDVSGAINFQAYGGSNQRTLASISSVVESIVSDTSVSGYLAFATTSAGISEVERMRLDSYGILTIGGGAYQGFAGGAPRLQVNGTSASASAIGASRWVAGSTGGQLQLAKSRGAAIGTRGVVVSGDDLGSLIWSGDDGAAFISGASISAQVDGTPGINDMPGRLIFSTTADGASSPTERMRIDNVGRIGIGATPSSTQRFVIGGTQTLGVSPIYLLNQQTIQSDATSTPSYFYSYLNSQPGAYTITGAYHFRADAAALGAGSALTSQYGFFAAAGLTGATNNYGFFGNIPAGTGRYNLYMGGTADNYLAGNTGIGGVTTSNYRLTLAGDGSTVVGGIVLKNSSTVVAYIGTPAANNAADLEIFNPQNGYIRFATNNTERMRIDSSGNVGIGTGSSTLTQPLTVNTAVNYGISLGDRIFAAAGTKYIGVTAAGMFGGNSSYIGFTNDGVNAGADIMYKAFTDGSMGGNHIFATNVASTTTERMRINSSGNVGIGGTAPNSRLKVYTTADGDGILLDQNGTTRLSLTADTTNLSAKISSGNVFLDLESSNATSRGIRFFTGSTSTECMRIDSAGNVSVGTTLAGADGLSISNGENLSFPEGSNSSLVNVFRQSSTGAAVLANGYKYTVTSSQFASSYAASWGKSAVAVASGAIKFYVDVPSTVAVGTDIIPTERMRIDSSGNWMLGKTTQAITTVGVSGLPNGRLMIGNAASTSADDGFQIYSTGAAAYRFFVSMDGIVHATNTTISAISDQRYKENIRDLDVGLDAVLALKPRKFDWKEGKGKNIKNDRGFIAQEFEQVFPDLIDEWKDPAPEGEEPYKSVRQDLIPVLVKAIQDQQALIESLSARVAQLEGK